MAESINSFEKSYSNVDSGLVCERVNCTRILSALHDCARLSNDIPEAVTRLLVRSKVDHVPDFIVTVSLEIWNIVGSSHASGISSEIDEVEDPGVGEFTDCALRMYCVIIWIAWSHCDSTSLTVWFFTLADITAHRYIAAPKSRIEPTAIDRRSSISVKPHECRIDDLTLVWFYDSKLLSI